MWLLQAEDADMNADIHGGWTVENAKSRLHQYLQMFKVRTDYQYKMIGPEHNRYGISWRLRHIYVLSFIPHKTVAL